MSAKTFGRALRTRRASVHDVCHSSLLSITRPAVPSTSQSSDINPSSSSSREFSTSSSLSASKQAIREQRIAKTPLPYFPKTHNQPLDSLLHSIHRDQFLIDHLPDHYQRLVVRTKRHHVLAQQASQQAFARGTNPSNATLTITLNGQTLPLRPLKHRTLHGSKTLTRVLNLINSPSEYDLLPGLMQGYGSSKIEIDPGKWRNLIRQCGLAGRPGVAIKIAHDGIVHRKNGFSYTQGSLREMVRAQFVRFLIPEKFHAEKSVKRARGVVGLARRWKEQFDEVRRKKRMEERAPGWLAVDPVVRGSLLFLQAGKVVRWDEGKETDLERGVMSDLKSLVECWDLAVEEIDLIDKELAGAPEASPTKDEDARPAYSIAREAIRDWEPVLQGLQWTQSVMHKSGLKDTDVEKWLPAASTLVSGAINRWRPVAVSRGNGERIGMQIYEGAYADLDGWYEKDLEGKDEGVVKDRIVLVEEEEEE
ncbi:uncharacterized protein DFL_002228 [Arthrobotrys flagrans]|uniref:Uncharacterized protein n=1 Tax=Arthrobotrys flagrans TaxID=97331 RepID=A0A437A9W4_ARTFL|nr:hypothetical protein DFL_002228 [Arthrobotrys flagrans]